MSKFAFAVIAALVALPALASPGVEEFKGKDGEFYFRVKAKNGEIVMQSEGYKQKENLGKVKAMLHDAACTTGHFRASVSHNKQFFFTLKAANGEVVGFSEMYTQLPKLVNGIHSVREAVGCNKGTPTIRGLAHKA